MACNDIIDAESFVETASKEELIDFLVKTIHNEVSKGDDADCDLIRECSDWLDELTEDEVVFTPEALERNLEKIKAKASDKPIKRRKKVSVKTFVRVALIAAVVFTISILSLSAVASNKGYDSTWEYISTNVGKLFGLSMGEQVDSDGVMFVKYSDSVHYSNISELITEENIGILYPNNLQSNIKITKVQMVPETTEKYTLYFIFSNNSYIFNVSNYYMNDASVIDTYECITIDDLKFYYTQKQENIFYSVLQHEGFEYTIQAPNYDDLLLIMNSMKG